MSLGSIEQRIQGLNMKTKELINQAYQQGYKAGQESNEGQYNRAWKEQANDYIEQGRNETLSAIKKIYLPVDEGGLPGYEIKKIFGKFGKLSWFNIITKFSASEIVEKLRDYEEQQMCKDFRVGDIIKTNNYKAYKAVITWCDGNHWNGVCLQGDNDSEVGMTYYSMDYDNWTKTGKTIPEIMEVLKKM